MFDSTLAAHTDRTLFLDLLEPVYRTELTERQSSIVISTEIQDSFCPSL